MNRRPTWLVLPLALCLALAGTARGDDACNLSLIPPGAIAADGTSRTLSILITDATGVPRADVPVTWTHAKIGEVGDWTTAGNGLWTATYTSPVLAEAGTS